MSKEKHSRAVELLQEFVRIPTINPPGRERAGTDFLAETCRSFGLDPELTKVEGDRFNVTCRISGTGSKPSLLYNGHIDVVPPGELPWSRDPFAAEVSGGRLYGRGASDMKSGLMAMLLAMEDLHQRQLPLQGDLIFSAVVDEEIEGIGAARMVEQGELESVGAVIISEPTGFRTYVAEKGTYWIALETYGRTAHGSMPELGRNAVIDMMHVLQHVTAIKLPDPPDPWHGPATLNVGTISGGVAANVVPDHCGVELDFRIPFGVDPGLIHAAVEKALENARAETPGLDVRIGRASGRVPVATNRDDSLVTTVLQVCRETLDIEPAALPVSYATDASILCFDPVLPFVVIGPGQESQAHQPDEYVEIKDYLKAIDLYVALAERLLG